MSDKPFRYPIWVRGDLDGFFGLMVDNLVQVLTIILLCTTVCGIPAELIFTRMLPGVAISLLIGNLFYGIQAHYIARKYRRPNTTALPYGINTPSVFAFTLFVMGPVYHVSVAKGMVEQDAAELAWKAGMLACLVSGVIEFLGAFFAEKLRRVTPRAALLGVLAGVGIALIASDFAFRIYAKPMVGLLPLGILLLAYFGRYRFPFGLPGGLLVVIFGTALAWGLSALGIEHFGGVEMSAGRLRAALEQVHWIQPVFCGNEVLSVLSNPQVLIPFLTVSIPMGLLNVLGSLQNIESAEAGGDKYATAPSLAVNGLGTIAAGLFGSCFPTTIYIGHPAWKSMGAKAGYSILNGLFFTLLFLFGCGTFLKELIPIEAGAAIVMYIGIVITAQAFQATPRTHAPAVAISLFPALVALLVVKFLGLMHDSAASITLAELLSNPRPDAQIPELPGILALFGANAGWMVSALILTAMGVAFIEKRYKAGAIWCGAATVLTLIGLLHSYRVEGNVIREFFIWQPDPTAEVQAVPAVASAPTTQTTPVTEGEPSGPVVFAYRAYPLAVGYGLATIIFTLAAISKQDSRTTRSRYPIKDNREPDLVAAREPPPPLEDLPTIPLADESPPEESERADSDHPAPPTG
ncbi:MAG: NCS2 family permease [Planctomycetota bacterium]